MYSHLLGRSHCRGCVGSWPQHDIHLQRPHRRSQSRRASKFRIAHVTAEAEPQVDEQADQQATPQPSPPQTVSSFLRGLLAPAIRPADPLLQAAEGIRQSIASGNEAVIPGLVDTLLSEGRPFEERRIGGGPWQVVWSRGPLLWQGWSAPGKLANFRNEASQDFDPNGRTVVNKAEVFGENFFVTANGTYEPQGDTSSTPVEVQTFVTGATLHAFGKELALPIRGKGTFTILYCDDSLRLLRGSSSSSLVVQIRADALRQLLGKRRLALEGQ